MTSPVLAVSTAELLLLEEAYRRLVEPGSPPASVAEPDVLLSLQARGMLDAAEVLRRDTIAGDLVGLVMDLMISSELTVIIERWLGPVVSGDGHPVAEAQSPDLRALHVHPTGACQQDIHPSGIHGFAVLTEPEEVTGSVHEILVPPDAAAGTGDSQTVSPDRIADLADILGSPVVLAEVTVLHRDTGAQAGCLVSLGPGGCYAGLLADTQGDEAADHHDGDGKASVHAAAVTFEPVHPGWIVDWIGAHVTRLEGDS